jgi:Flp pilus assembly protein TadG
MTLRERDDEGQLSLLILGYTVIAAMLVAVVVDLSHAFLYRRALAAAADGAAVAAASSPDLDALYRQGAATQVPLDEVAARAAVEQYARDGALGDRFRDFDVVAVDVHDGTVSVTLAARVRLPLVTRVVADWRDGNPVGATATAVVPVR